MSRSDEISWKFDLKECLDKVECHGEFAVSIPVSPPLLHPKLTIDGMSEEHGRMSFPLSPNLAQAIRDCSASEKAPFGKDSDTVLDENIRKAWQIDASKVILHEKLGEHAASPSSWGFFLQSTTQSLAKRLGLSSSQLASVDTNLYKMLLYEEGGHFTKHRDTEKEPGMFGTLVIQFPSLYERGE